MNILVSTAVQKFEEELAALPQLSQKIHHEIFGGLYCRTGCIPANVAFTGQIHKHDHINIVVGDITIVTDNSKCDTVQRLVAEGCKLNSEGYVSKFEHTSDTRAMCDFDLLVQSKNIAISQSSFSWWAAFLGNHDKVIFPYKKEGGMWPCTPGIDDVDLFFESPANIKHIQ